ncbi:ATP phosphoribosyltransferase regulatory subunit [Melghirimyces profundicolus]|uniref:ATP phosphoribosyltransferase regulatory subunit n=1 Tax=Melghirimyces profundicolus TaxID=1242148 RepID=A0A2T6BUC4_9BACL|nr:ATP phosphoribosyltransferase regulatory subunit [Melghirimyces profundicolus]PTX59636.1 ATP phosphoribosyltransferase regulatory subunit [Melghirimyces profundicolus]
MAKPREFEKPMGVRDFPPELVSKMKWVEERVEERFRAWGYREVWTPTLEFFDTVGRAGAIEEHKLFKLLDGEGRTLVLRPDQTAPIARVVSSLMRNHPFPLRLCYHANVFRAQEREAGRNAEFFQSGVELVGDDTPEADAEVIALAVEALEACGVRNIQIAVGHIGLLDALLMEYIEDPEAVSRLKESLGRRNLVEFRERVRDLDVAPERREDLFSLLSSRGERRLLDRLETGDHGKAVGDAVSHLKEMWEALEDWDVASRVELDLSLVGSLEYYTGMYFEGYGSDGFYLLSGGRYDHLLGQFGRPGPARGFALKTDRLIMAGPGQPERPERIALIYPRRYRQEACRMAGRLRRKGKCVTLFASEAGHTPPSFSGFDRIEEVIGDDDPR